MFVEISLMIQETVWLDPISLHQLVGSTCQDTFSARRPILSSQGLSVLLLYKNVSRDCFVLLQKVLLLEVVAVQAAGGLLHSLPRLPFW